MRTLPARRLRWVPLFTLFLFTTALSAAPILVTTTADEYGSGTACSLREAIRAANDDAAFGGCTAGRGNDTIVLSAGVYLLTRSGSGDDTNATGDLDIRSALSIQGILAATTVLDGNQLDRVLDVHDGGILTLSGLTVRNGAASGDGGGIRNQGALIAAGVEVVNNAAGGDGGGLYNRARAQLVASLLEGNTATNGGGFANFSPSPLEGELRLTNSTVSNNEASNMGGGATSQRNVSLSHVTITDNRAQRGGGVFDDVEPVESLPGYFFRSSVVANNTALSGEGDDCLGDPSSIGFNLFETQGCSSVLQGTDQEGLPALLSPLADNGGPTRTHLPMPSSPLLDAGATTDALNFPIPRDQRGYARGAQPDVGAAERDAPVASAVFMELLLLTDAFVVGGDSFTFSAALFNLSPTAQTGTYWTRATLQAIGFDSGPLVGPTTATLPPHSVTTRRLTQLVPSGLQSGTYTYSGRFGDFPNDPIAASGFRLIGLGGAAPRPPVARSAAATSSVSVFPNPFTTSASMHFILDASGPARLSVYDVLGREVSLLHDGPLEAGEHTVRFAPQDLAPGVYVYRLTTDGKVQSGQMTLVR